MSQDNDKRELLKLKQGLINSSDAVPEDGYDVQMPATTGEKAKNWLWYHKLMLVVGILLVAVGSVIAALYYFKPKPDIEIYSVTRYSTTTVRLLESNLPRYCEDNNGDGKSTVAVHQGPDETTLSFIEKYQEIENGSSQIFVGKKADLEQVYEDMTQAEGKPFFVEIDTAGADGYLIDFTSTPLGKELKIFSQEIYLAVKKTDDERQEYAEQFVADIISNNEKQKDA